METEFKIDDYYSVIFLNEATRKTVAKTLSEVNQIITYPIIDNYKINNFSKLGFKDDYYYFDYEISKRDDMINNINILYCSKFELLIDNMPVTLPEKYNLYTLLLTFSEIKLRIYFHKDDIVKQFKITYNAYLFPQNIKHKLRVINGNLNFSNCFKPLKIKL